MAPECFTPSKEYKVDGRIDVWSTGVILYAMLMGELPFKGATVEETIEAIKLGKYKLNPALAKRLTPQCLEVMEKCLEVDPKNRPAMKELLTYPWLSGDIFQQNDQKC
jgi:serine/threonine protein kinase